MSVNRDEFGHFTTAAEVLDGFDLTGKTILITGGSSGLGAECAKVFADKGAKVIITARSIENAQPVVAAIKEEIGADVEVLALELGNLANVREFARKVLDRQEKIDILINNAGVMACPYAETDDGFELQFGTNHLGHFLMTNLIAPALQDNGRVLSISSAAHVFAPVVFDDILYKDRDYEKWDAYGQSKTANALFAVGLNKRLSPRGIEAFSVYPGGIDTPLFRHGTEEDAEKFRPLIEAGKIVMKTLEQGIATHAYAATAPEISGLGGSYLTDCGIAEISEDSDELEKVVRPYAIDPAAAERLWDVSEKMVGQQFPY